LYVTELKFESGADRLFAFCFTINKCCQRKQNGAGQAEQLTSGDAACRNRGLNSNTLWTDRMS